MFNLEMLQADGTYQIYLFNQQMILVFLLFLHFKELPSNLQHKRPEKFEFFVEFYDINNNISEKLYINLM